ncbi:hypothetical protein IQ260_07740 [Leptolyngbya cf. ectocarpi LEGE 11479]|uniref:Uncharacterized protein n=1 Tax=Leptolyngbya cf. ectocarpi LEGE 11479 TaxID=1828722 RepID=A0A928X161_LEPEC|nr:hypothetical protein [Leptolyngbya ectocarpi]MBE9066542.1 hypothetical protein [Leptolyngbya cf. ectocarpi LEGE 11479]
MSTYSLRIKALFPLSLLLLTVVACGGNSANTGASSSDTSQPPVESTPVEEPLEVDEPEPPEEQAEIVLALSGDGVSVIDSQSGKSKNIPFETDLATSQTAISAALGDPTETSENAECGAGPMSFVTWSNGFQISAMQDQFVGWSVREDITGDSLTTVDGVGIGSTLTDLEENYDVGVIESSLGAEFNASNSLFGLLSANESDGVITNIWAGVVCNFR